MLLREHGAPLERMIDLVRGYKHAAALRPKLKGARCLRSRATYTERQSEDFTAKTLTKLRAEREYHPDQECKSSEIEGPT